MELTKGMYDIASQQSYKHTKMTNSTQVSIVIPTYKRSKKLKFAIESALNQSYKNIEIIIVDDNFELPYFRRRVQEITNEYSTIKLIQNSKRLGGALSRNVGIQEANGWWISFLDDDDVYEQNRIEELIKCYRDHQNENVGLIYSYSTQINSQKNIVGYIENDFEGTPIYQHMLNCIASTSLWLCPKDVLIEVGMFDDSPSKQDSILLLKILVNGYKIFRVPLHLVQYLEHDGVRISGYTTKNIEGTKIYRNMCRNYYNLLEYNQVKSVEYTFSKKLLVMYLINNMKPSARVELKSMLKSYPFKLGTLFSTIKYLFPTLYIKYIKTHK